MLVHRVLPIVAVLFLALAESPAARAASSAVSALISAEHSRYHNNDIERPTCFVLQGWAQCSFGTGHGNAEVNAWLHLKAGSWRFLGEGGGVTSAPMLEKSYGIPAPIAKQFAAKQ